MAEKPLYIQKDSELIAFCERQQTASWLACDTEFIRERSFYPELCLIQLASPNELALIDPIALRDLTPLIPLLTHPRIVKIFHAAYQDLEVIWQTLQIMPTPIFDTQLAALVMELGDQISYANLVKHFTQIELDKSATRTNWRQRPLSEIQIQYAADDVRYLGKLYELSDLKLREMGRETWLEDDFNRLSDPGPYCINPDDAWLKLKGYRGLTPLQQTVLQKLAAWRERTAMTTNSPRRWVIGDDSLIDLARRLPNNFKQLRLVKNLTEGQIEKHGAQWLAHIAEVEKLTKSEQVILQNQPMLTHEQEILVEVCLSLIKLWSKEAHLTVTPVAQRSDIEAFLLGDPNCVLRRGWRWAWMGQPLEKFLVGKGYLRVDKHCLRFITSE